MCHYSLPILPLKYTHGAEESLTLRTGQEVEAEQEENFLQKLREIFFD